MGITDRQMTEDDERRLKNLATKVMSNGVEVLVRDKHPDNKAEQRKLKLVHTTSLKQLHHATSPSLLSSAVATVVNHQQLGALFPLHQLMQHNYIIKSCMTTFTYLTTVVHNKRSAVSTFETIVSVVTTESLTNLFASDIIPDIKPTKTKFVDVNTVHATIPNHMLQNDSPKIDKRIDDEDNFDLIQPSEVGHRIPCTTSCSCSHSKTDALKTTYVNLNEFSATKLDVRPSNKETLDKKTQFGTGPYEFESSSQLAPTDKVVEKYTEVISDYSDEKDTNSLKESELLTNEQAPSKTNKIPNKNPEKTKPDKPQKLNKNKFVVADLLKLGTLGIKGLSQLAPVIEKMTGGFIKRQDSNKTTTSTVKPVTKITAYNANKRFDGEMESKQNNFPIYIPVDELETSESQVIFTNATLHQNLAWAAEHKQPKAHIVPPKIIHESPLVNGGIPISPGEIITANSDVIVGKPAVGGPLTLAASGIKLHNPVKPPSIDSFVSGNEQYSIKEKPPLSEQALLATKIDDSFDLRPPELPKIMPNRHAPRPSLPTFGLQNSLPNKMLPPHQSPLYSSSEQDMMKTEPIKTTLLGNHGRPAFLDYIPSLAKVPAITHTEYRPQNHKAEDQDADNSPSSSEVINTHVTTNGEHIHVESMNKPFLVDIQPSRVANVLIPHGSSTALVFAGSSEPHKTGDYVDDPLPYPEPGYFGSFSIDAPQMTNVHNVAPNNNKQQFLANSNTHHPLDIYKTNLSPPLKEESFRNDLKPKRKDNKYSIDVNKIPAPTSSQHTHVQVGPQIAVYNPDNYHPSNGNFNKYNQRGNKHKDGKEVIDNEYENYLAVPPPPPPKVHYNQENHFDKTKPFNQRPIIHTKPVQDMKVFLNIQHPVSKSPSHEQLPPKVTSEIYFAAQAPSHKPTPTYTIHIPPAPQLYGNTYNKPTNQVHKGSNTIGSSHHSFSVPTSPITYNKSKSNDIHDKEATYSVTLNTATNVASNVGDIGQVIGSSIPVSIGTSSSVNQMKTDIPIGTNFAIRVEDEPARFEDAGFHGNRPIVYDEHGRVPNDISVGGNKWNKSSIDKTEFDIKHDAKYSGIAITNKPVKDYTDINHSLLVSHNSHANFPMIHDEQQKNIVATTPTVYENVKSVTEHLDNIKLSDKKRPAKVIPNIPTNSHGWYSSVPVNVNSFNKINNIKVTTRKVIPLLHDYDKDNVPDYGHKISSIGKPPTEFWVHNASPILTNIGKPFTKAEQTEKHILNRTPSTIKPINSNYIPSSFSVDKQPAYDIPIRDNSDETTTAKTTQITANKLNPVYENSEEIYDGEEEIDSKEIDSEVSSESMKVPVISVINKIENVTKSTTELTLLQEEVYEPLKNEDDFKIVSEFNTGTQTEKPFVSSSKPTFQSNTIKPVYNNNIYMKPRPFTMNTLTTLDHQLQQPHWQINQLMENSTYVSYEEGLDLNIGEEINSETTTKTSSAIASKPQTTSKIPYRHSSYENKYKRPQRPVFSLRPNNTYMTNDTNIITSTLHIKDKKPLLVEEFNEKSTLPSFTTTSNMNINHSSSEIIDLSPPPPTMDYNFKPSTNDEMIMGMSPPPPRNPPVIRPPIRMPPTPRPIPIRTPPPYRTKPPRTIPPRLPTQKATRKPINRDDVSTYRPSYDILSNVNHPSYDQDQPSSQLLPPLKEVPSRVMTSLEDIPTSSSDVPLAPNVVFPTLISSGWQTSSGIEFSSSFEFAPTSIHFPGTLKPSIVSDFSDASSTENSNSYEPEDEQIDENSSEQSKKPVSKVVSISEEISTETTMKTTSSEEESIDDSLANESGMSQEEATTNRINIFAAENKERTRKPYPIRKEDKTSTTKLFSKPSSIIKPTRTLNRPGLLYPTRYTSIRKIIRPVQPTKSPAIKSSIIESSESFVDEDFIKPTEVLHNIKSTILQPEIPLLEKSSSTTVVSIIDDVETSEIPTDHAGNEVKVVDEIIPTKTEFKTTVVTLTKTLSEPPQTVSSIGYINITHTLTVTHTQTSLLSQSEGAVTQTLVLTNTETSTRVDVVTEIHTQVQPTTIIETVTKHIPVSEVEPTPVVEVTSKTKMPLDDISMSSEENNNLIIKDNETTENIQKVGNESENDNDTFFVVINKSQNGGPAPPVNNNNHIETGDYDGIIRNEQVNSNGVSQVLFGEILLAGTPYLETANVANPTGVGYGKECQPDCKASRNERCQRIDGMMKCVCRPGFARMFPDRPCKPTYTYSVKLALSSQGNENLQFHENLSDNSSKQYQVLAAAAHEGINRMVMQSDLRDVFHGVHITGFQPVIMKKDDGELYQGVMNDFYVQLSDNAHESRLKEVIEKYLRNNNYSLGGTDVHAAGELMDKLEVNDFDECTSGQFHDCSEHAQCFNLRGTYTCSCLEGFADLSVNNMYPGRICSAEPVGCEMCNYHGACYSRDDRRVLCECFQWYAGSTCHINLKVVLISLVVLGILLTLVFTACAVVACSRRPRPPPRSIVACIQSMPGLHQGAMPSKQQRADRRALINEREFGDASSVQNASLPYIPAKRPSSSKKCVISEPPAHDPPPPPAPAVMIPRARLHPHHVESRDNVTRKKSMELSSEEKLISYLEAGAVNVTHDEMRRKHSMESSYSANKDRQHNKQGALVSAGFKVSTTVRAEETSIRDERDDVSSVNKAHLEEDLSRFDSLRKSYSQEDMSEWTDAERRLGELTLSEARSVGGTLPASTGRAASSTRLTHQEANTMAERELGSTFLLPHVHLYKPDLTSDVSEFDSL